MQLKREIAGTSRIEGAEFTDQEFEAAMLETRDELATRSQRQVSAMMRTYRRIRITPDDRPIDLGVLRAIHREIVTGADEDRCPPGEFRGRDQNVTFGSPRHRGVEGGDDCARAMETFVRALQVEFPDHDPLIQALAAHYHFAAMHPFLDGNGRTARALEALLLQRAGLRDICFVAMSNYYYEEKKEYLAALHDSGVAQHDLTPFLLFGLKGIARQSQRVSQEIQRHIAIELFRSLALDLFQRLKSPRRRVISMRQTRILNRLLEDDWVEFGRLAVDTELAYRAVRSARKALIRDLDDLLGLGAIKMRRTGEGGYEFAAHLDWPMEITESEFFERLGNLPRSRTHSFLR
jgi:Fic family protein